MGGIKVGTNLSIDANGVLSATDTTYSVFGKSGSTASTGLVPKPSTTAGTTKYLREDGTWTVPPDNNTITTVSVTGSGNAITNITDSNGALTATKGETFSLSTHSHSDATESASGFMSASDKTKLNGIATNANNYSLPIASSSVLGGIKVGTNLSIDSSTGVLNATDTVYTHPTTSGNKHIPSGGSTGKFLKWKADGEAEWADDNNTTYSVFVQSGSSAASGLVPTPPSTAGTTKYLREDGTWAVPPNDNTVYTLPNATTSTLGGVIVGSGLSVNNGTISVDDQLPSQTGNSGKYLTTNGTSASWVNVDALPAQTNNAGKFLTTDGTDASWSDILDEIKVSSIHYPTTNATTIVLTEQQAIPSTINKYAMTVYRDGIYLNPSVDYGYNSTTRTLTFTEAFDEDEVVTVVFTYVTTDSQVTLDLDVDEYEAGTGITFTPNAITNKVTISADSFPTQTGNSGKYLTTDGTSVSWGTVESYELPIASSSTLGGIKVGTNLSINNGVLSADDQIPSQANNSGKYLTTNGTSISWGTIESYTLPTASSSTLGGIKVGNNLSINNSTGVLSADDQLPSQSGNSGKFLTTNGSAVSWATVDALPSQTGNSGKFLTTNGTTASWVALPVVETLTTSEVEDIFDTALGLSNS